MRKLNLILSIILLIVCGFFYSMTFKLPAEARIYPIFVNTLFMILSLTFLVKSYLNKDSEEAKNFKNIELKQLIFILVTGGIYIVLINILGYIISTILYVLVALIGLQVSKKNSVLITIGFCLFIYVLFKLLLKVPLPDGFII